MPAATRHAAAHDAGIPHADRIVFFLGDGLGIPVVTAARIYAHGEEGALALDGLAETAFVRTYSRDSRVTDSAPSMSAYMTGVKMNNDVIAMSPETPVGGEGTPVPTLLEQAEAAGWSTGIVTTTRVTHATPAATYAHVSHRDWEDLIATQLVPGGAGYNAQLGDGLDVIFGGGSRHFLPASAPGGARSDGRDLLAELSATGRYRRVEHRAGLLALSLDPTVDKVIGLFGPSHLSYELLRPSTEPSLAEMAVKAVQLLDRNAQGFFLMVEGGRIDHALHDTTAKKALAEVAAFDAAVRAALEVVDLDDTLVVVTADHDHTMTMNGYGQRGAGLSVLDVVREPATGVPALDADGLPYPTLVFGNGPNRPAVRSGSDTLNVLDKGFLQLSAVRVASETHGGGDVMLMAGGAGSRRLKGTLDNIDVFHILREALQL